MLHRTKGHFSFTLAGCLSLAMIAQPSVLASGSYSNRAFSTPDQETEAAPVYRDHKGVSIGMTADEVRKKLGEPTEKGDTQDFYLIPDKESCQIFYDNAHKVTAISVSYFDANKDAPTPKAVLGSDIEAKPDGSMHKMVRYPKAGYFVSYSRTAGTNPMVIVVMQKIP
jgi:outer membrane protein assembly factor BamE (lipoprotein component of BamABCDE complex)